MAKKHVIGSVREDGTIKLDGRSKDMIIRGGENIQEN